MNKPWPLHTLVEVDWIDSCSDSGWGNLSEHEHDGATCRTAGYLIKMDKRKVQIAQNQSSWSGHVGDVMTIPRSCVQHIRTLKGGGK